MSILALRTPAAEQRIREPFGDRVFLIVVTLMLSVLTLLVLMPLVYIVASSFSSASAVSAGRVVFWPVEFSLRAYKEALTNPAVLHGYYNSLIYAIGGTLISVTLTVAIAYPLSRKTFFGRNVIMTALIFTMLFSGGPDPDVHGGAGPRPAEHAVGAAAAGRDRCLAGDHRPHVLRQLDPG